MWEKTALSHLASLYGIINARLVPVYVKNADLPFLSKLGSELVPALLPQGGVDVCHEDPPATGQDPPGSR